MSGGAATCCLCRRGLGQHHGDEGEQSSKNQSEHSLQSSHPSPGYNLSGLPEPVMRSQEDFPMFGRLLVGLPLEGRARTPFDQGHRRGQRCRTARIRQSYTCRELSQLTNGGIVCQQGVSNDSPPAAPTNSSTGCTHAASATRSNSPCPTARCDASPSSRRAAWTPAYDDEGIQRDDSRSTRATSCAMNCCQTG